MINKQLWKEYITECVKKIISEKDLSEITYSNIPEAVAQIPPKPEMGDLAFPMFIYSKILKTSPDKISVLLYEFINSDRNKPDGSVEALGPYLNVKIDVSKVLDKLYEDVINSGNSYGSNSTLDGKRIMVEFSCPNTNKPLHLGHVRNDCLGFSISKILEFNGANVLKVNLINNRGIHICKSMLAYSLFGNNETPDSSGIKGDHLVGKYYVKYNEWANNNENAQIEAQNLLKKWEEGDTETVKLWSLMNGWALDGIKETYKNTGIDFDKYYYESETYKLGKDEVLNGYKNGIFQKQEDGAIYIEDKDKGIEKKILLRKDGTSIYITQDIGTAIMRHKDWPFDSLIYVVASEQKYHFKVLFYVLDKLGFKWAKNLHHLSYGMVFLPSGKMKSREGIVVDADDLLKELEEISEKEIISKGHLTASDDIKSTSHKIAVGALNYYILQFNPERDITFNPEESINFNGNTGPYLQYMGARICSVLNKFDNVSEDFKGYKLSPEKLSLQDEKQIIKFISDFPNVVKKAALNYDPSYVCSYLYELLKTFSHYYHDNQILNLNDKSLTVSRICLCRMILVVVKNGFSLVGIPFLERM